MDVQRLNLLEELVNELIKDHPEESKIKHFMDQTGVRYTEDPIERLDLVLKALHFQEEIVENSLESVQDSEQN